MEDTKNHGTVRVGHHLLVGALAAAATVCATSAVATNDMFLKIGDIKGESTDKNHLGEIDVLAWSWGVSSPITGDKKSATLPACAQPLSLTKFIDRATPPLIMNLALNTTIPSAKLTVRKAGANPIEYLILTLTGVTVKAESTGGSTGEDRLTENLSLAFTSATVTYTPQNPDGTPSSPASASIPGTCP
jgi:type VI secretion system secreted protein Hcp